MQGEKNQTPGNREVSWWWHILGLILALSVYWYATEMFSLWFAPYLFVPLMTGWLAHRHGHRILGLLIWLGLLSAFQFDANLVDHTLNVRLGIPLFVYLCSLGTALAFSLPLPATDLPSFNSRWRWARWLFVIGLGLAMILNPFSLPLFEKTLKVSTQVGFIVLLAVLVIAVEWQTVKTWWRRVAVDGETRWRGTVRLIFIGTIILAFVLLIWFETGYSLRTSFGHSSAVPVLFALAFLLPAFGLSDWRVILLIVLALFAVDWSVFRIYEFIEAASVAEAAAATDPAVIDDAFLIEEIVISVAREVPIIRQSTRGLIPCICATLLAVSLAPFWRYRDATRMRNRRSVMFLFLSLLVLFTGILLMDTGVDTYDQMLLGGIAFGMGLIWQLRGVIAGTFIIQVGYLLTVVLSMDGYEASAYAYDLVSIGLLAFPFAYLGMLSNRYQGDQAC